MRTNTRAVIDRYFRHLTDRGPWETAFAEDMTFTSHTSPAKTAGGRTAFVAATKRFYGSIGTVGVREILVDGDRACAFTRYEIRPPNGSQPFTSDIAEHLRVENDVIVSFEIHFDSAPYPK